MLTCFRVIPVAAASDFFSLVLGYGCSIKRSCSLSRALSGRWRLPTGLVSISPSPMDTGSVADISSNDNGGVVDPAVTS